MNRYAVFGASLETDAVFPELPASTAAPRWVFRASASLDDMRDAIELGAELIYGDVHARLHRHSSGHRIVVDDTGAYDVSDDGRIIACEPRPGAWPDFVRAHLLGRVLAFAFHHDGFLPLHASAVTVGGGACVFLAPKGYGKSSLALELVGRGARLIADDAVPVEPGPAPRAWPGVPAVRVTDDALASMPDARVVESTRDGKLLAVLDANRVQADPLPIHAVYFLDPIDDDGSGTPPSRERASTPLAAVATVAHVKAAAMFGADAARTLLDRAAALVATVPAYRLTMRRADGQVAAVADAIVRWHADGDSP